MVFNGYWLARKSWPFLFYLLINKRLYASFGYIFVENRYLMKRILIVLMTLFSLSSYSQELTVQCFNLDIIQCTTCSVTKSKVFTGIHIIDTASGDIVGNYADPFSIEFYPTSVKLGSSYWSYARFGFAGEADFLASIDCLTAGSAAGLNDTNTFADNPQIDGTGTGTFDLADGTTITFCEECPSFSLVDNGTTGYNVQDQNSAVQGATIPYGETYTIIQNPDGSYNLRDGDGNAVGDSFSALTEAQVDAFVANNGYLLTEVDGSITNEIQALTSSSDTIFLSNGGGFVVVPSGESTTTTDGTTINFTQTGDDITAEVIQGAINTSAINNDAGFITVDTNTELDTFGTIVNDSIFRLQTPNGVISNTTIRTTENDPIFNSSLASDITAADTTRWGTPGGSESTTVTDGTTINFTQTGNDITAEVIQGQINTSQINNDAGFITVDTNTELDTFGTIVNDSIFRLQTPNGVISNTTIRTTENDPVFNSSLASDITAIDTTRWGLDTDPTNEIELPNQAGQAGKVLSTDGTDPEWIDATTATDIDTTISVISGNANTNVIETITGTHKEYLVRVNESEINLDLIDTSQWSNFVNDAESDPVFNAHLSSDITSTDTTRWGVNTQTTTVVTETIDTDGLPINTYVNELGVAYPLLKGLTPWRDQLDGVTKTDDTDNALGIITHQKVAVAPDDNSSGSVTPTDVRGLYVRTNGTSSLQSLQRWRSGHGTVADITENGDFTVGSNGQNDQGEGVWMRKDGRTSISRDGLALIVTDLGATTGDMIRLRQNNNDIAHIGLSAGNKIHLKALSKKLTLTAEGVIEVPVASSSTPPAPSSGAGITFFNNVYYKWDPVSSSWIAF